MGSGKKEAGEEREVIHEEAELGLVFGPVRRPVERKGEEDHIGRGEQRRLGKEGAGQEAGNEEKLEDRRDPCERQGQGEPGGGDIARRAVDVHQLEADRHDEDGGEDQASDEDRRRGPCPGLRFCGHWTLHFLSLARRGRPRRDMR